MRWPWRRRGRRPAGRVVFIGTSPFDVAAAIAAVPTPQPVVSAYVPDEVFADEPAGTPVVGVQLGFADGSVLELADDDPRAIALRAAAANLVGGDR